MKNHKSHPLLGRVFRIIAWSTLLPLSATATTYTWTGGGTTADWSEAGNWSGNSRPPSNSFDTALVFTGSGHLSSLQDLSPSFLLNALTFDANAGAFIISGIDLNFGNTLSGTGPALTRSSGSAIEIRNNLTLSNSLTFSNTTSISSTIGLVTLSGVISGSGGLIINGNGGTAAALALTNANTYTGSTTWTQGTVRISSDASLGAAPSSASNNLIFTSAGFSSLQLAANAGAVTLNANRNIQLAAGAARATFDTNGATNGLTIPGVISGSGGINKYGDGTLTLTGTNTFTGGTQISGGTVSINSLAALGGTPVGAVHNNVQFLSNQSATQETLQLAAGAGSITIGVNRNISIDSGVTGFFDTNGGSNSLTIAGIVNGAGSLGKAGLGALYLTGTNTYAGGTNISGGVLNINSDAALGAASATNRLMFTGAGSTLQLGTSALTLDASRFVDTLTGATATFDTNGANNALTIGGNISGGGSVVLTGGGTLALPGLNSYTGSTSVKSGTLLLRTASLGAWPILYGDLVLGNSVNPGAAGGAVARVGHSNVNVTNSNLIVYSDGLFDGNNFASRFNAVTMSGGEVRLGNGGLVVQADVTINGAATAALISSTTFDSNLSLNNTSHLFTVGRGSSIYDLDVQAGMTSGSLTKTGAGVMRLAGTNNPNLAVTLNAGTLALASDTVLGNTAGSNTFTLAGGTVAADGGNRTIANPVALNGSATVGASLDGTARAISFTGGVTLGGSYTLTNNNTALTTLGGTFALGGNTLTLGGTGSTTFSGPITGTGGLTINNPGTTTLSAASTYSGATTISAGTFVVGSTGSITGGNIAVGSSTLGAVLTISDNGSVSPGAGKTLMIDGTNATPGSVTIGASTTLSTGAAFVGGSEIATFTQNGGSFTTNGAGLNFGLNFAVGAQSTYNLNSGTLSTGDVALGRAGRATFNQTDGVFTTNGNSITMAVQDSGRATYNLDGGTLTTNAVARGSGQATFNFNGGTLTAAASNAAFFQGLTTANVRAGGATISTGTNAITIAQPLLHDTAAGAPAIDGGLTKLGLGTLTLSGANTYTGATSVNTGTLLVNGTNGGAGTFTVTNSGSVLGGTGSIAGAVTVTSGGALNPGNNVGVAGASSVVGTLSVGALTLNNSANAIFDVNSPTLYDELTATGTVNLGGATLTLNVNPNAAFVSGQVLDLFHTTGTLSGSFAGINNGSIYSFGGNAFQAVYTSTDFELVAVPEPATWLAGVLTMLVFTLGWRSRLRRSVVQTFSADDLSPAQRAPTTLEPV